MYEGCGVDQYLFATAGGSGIPADPIDAFDLFGVPGALATGSRPCCEGRSAECLFVQVHRWDASLVQVALHFVETYFRVDTGCAGILVEFTGLTEPRCSADDPECLPMACVAGSVYDPDGTRSPIDYGTQVGTCSHDGDCLADGDTCRSYQEPEEVIGFECELDGAFCGCVEGECQWFSQDDG